MNPSDEIEVGLAVCPICAKETGCYRRKGERLMTHARIDLPAWGQFPAVLETCPASRLTLKQARTLRAEAQKQRAKP